MSMPEEINRLCTDAVADLLFTTDEIASENLRREGIAEENIAFVGNTMIDSLLRHHRRARDLPLPMAGRQGLRGGHTTPAFKRGFGRDAESPVRGHPEHR
jgi:UDP-N-acetylglucosamine 2-epimerase